MGYQEIIRALIQSKGNLSARSAREYKNDDPIYKNGFYIKFSKYFLDNKDNFLDISSLISSDDN